MPVAPNGNRRGREYRLGVTLVLAAAFCISTMGLGIRLMESATLWQILFYRSIALALLLLFATSVESRGRPVRAMRSSGWSGVIGAIALVVAFSGGIASVQLTTVANAMLLFSTAPFMAAIIGLVFLRESVRRGTWIAMAVSLAGVAVMVSGGVARGHWLGNLTALLQALGFAVFAVSLRWRQTNDTLSAVLLGALLAIGVSGGLCLLTGQTFILTPLDFGISLGLGVFQIGVGIILFSRGAKYVPASELALLSMAEVLLAPIWVWIFLAETAGTSTVVGGGILLAALAGNAVSGMRKPI